MKTKGEINNNLKEINEQLREIRNTLYWYLEIPTQKLIDVGIEDAIKRRLENIEQKIKLIESKK